jgi:hypothetical protein
MTVLRPNSVVQLGRGLAWNLSFVHLACSSVDELILTVSRAGTIAL